MKNKRRQYTPAERAHALAVVRSFAAAKNPRPIPAALVHLHDANVYGTVYKEVVRSHIAAFEKSEVVEVAKKKKKEADPKAMAETRGRKQILSAEDVCSFGVIVKGILAKGYSMTVDQYCMLLKARVGVTVSHGTMHRLITRQLRLGHPVCVHAHSAAEVRDAEDGGRGESGRHRGGQAA